MRPRRVVATVSRAPVEVVHRRRRAGGLGPYGVSIVAEVLENAAHDGGLLDEGDEAEAATAGSRAVQAVDVEAAAHEVGPGVVGAWRGEPRSARCWPGGRAA